jgi:ferredoxin
MSVQEAPQERLVNLTARAHRQEPAHRSFARLAERSLIADCYSMPLICTSSFLPTIRERHVFMSGHQAVVMEEVCCNCGVCLPECRFGAIREPAPEAGHDTYWIDPTACEGCGVCLETCPMDVIEFPERRCGEWMISDTACGPMVHARLGVAAENSGKSSPRASAGTADRRRRRAPLILVDGHRGSAARSSPRSPAPRRAAGHRADTLGCARPRTRARLTRHSASGGSLRQQVGNQPGDDRTHRGPGARNPAPALSAASATTRRSPVPSSRKRPSSIRMARRPTTSAPSGKKLPCNEPPRF